MLKDSSAFYLGYWAKEKKQQELNDEIERENKIMLSHTKRISILFDNGCDNPIIKNDTELQKYFKVNKIRLMLLKNSSGEFILTFDELINGGEYTASFKKGRILSIEGCERYRRNNIDSNIARSVGMLLNEPVELKNNVAKLDTNGKENDDYDDCLFQSKSYDIFVEQRNSITSNDVEPVMFQFANRVEMHQELQQPKNIFRVVYVPYAVSHIIDKLMANGIFVLTDSNMSYLND